MIGFSDLHVPPVDVLGDNGQSVRCVFTLVLEMHKAKMTRSYNNYWDTLASIERLKVQLSMVSAELLNLKFHLLWRAIDEWILEQSQSGVELTSPAIQVSRRSSSECLVAALCAQRSRCNTLLSDHSRPCTRGVQGAMGNIRAYVRSTWRMHAERYLSMKCRLRSIEAGWATPSKLRSDTELHFCSHLQIDSSLIPSRCSTLLYLFRLSIRRKHRLAFHFSHLKGFTITLLHSIRTSLYSYLVKEQSFVHCSSTSTALPRFRFSHKGNNVLPIQRFLQYSSKIEALHNEKSVVNIAYE